MREKSFIATTTGIELTMIILLISVIYQLDGMVQKMLERFLTVVD
jgi:hypothetical protein